MISESVPFSLMIRGPLILACVLVLASGCGAKREPSPNEGTTGASSFQTEPKGSTNSESVKPQDPLEELRRIQQRLTVRRAAKTNDLVRRRSELEQQTAELKNQLTASGLSMEAAAKLFQSPSADQSGSYSRLMQEYDRVSRLRVHVLRLEKLIVFLDQQSHQIQLQVQRRDFDKELETTLSDSERQAIQDVVQQATAETDVHWEQQLKDPIQATERDQADRELQASLKRRIGALPKRTETKREDLPASPMLMFETASLAEQVVLESLVESLTESDARATKFLAEGHPESAIAVIQEGIARVQKELNSFQPTPAWKKECDATLEQFRAALSEHLATPYLNALKLAIPAAYKGKEKDWTSVLSLLEELVRLAPKAKGITELTTSTQQLLNAKVNAGDVDARVSLERFNEILKQLNQTTIPITINGSHSTPRQRTNGKSNPPISLGPEKDGPVDLSEWNAAQLELAKSVQGYCSQERRMQQEQRKRSDLVHVKFASSKDVRDQDDLIVAEKQKLSECLVQVKVNVSERIKSAARVVQQYDQHITDLQRDYNRIIDPNGEGHQPDTAVARNAQAKIEAARFRRNPYSQQADKSFSMADDVDIQDLIRQLRWIGLEPGQRVSLEIKNVEFAFRWCPPGTFKMRDAPVDVTITRGFWMLETEVTQAMWQVVMGTELDWSDKGKGPKYPVYNVNHTDAGGFCEKLSVLLQQEHAVQAVVCRLPTEAEWEYAARAGTTDQYFFGESEDQLQQYAWYDKNSGEKTHEVQKLKPNAWGLFDIYGNVWEWCADWYDDKSTGGRDPKGPTTGSYRVRRGGSWYHSAGYCRSANRFWDDPSYRYYFLGFRPCLSSAESR